MAPQKQPPVPSGSREPQPAPPSTRQVTVAYHIPTDGTERKPSAYVQTRVDTYSVQQGPTETVPGPTGSAWNG